MQTSILDWLDERATADGDKVGVRDPDGTLTFSELKDDSVRAATWLIGTAGMGPRRAVALYLEKSPQALSVMLGTLAAGGFYSVIDVRHPASRARTIARTLDPIAIICDEKSSEGAHEAAEGTDIPVVSIDELLGTDADEALVQARRATRIDTDPVYVNFTSGSTGTPKGVVVCERSLLDFIPVFCSTFDISPTDVLANQAPFDFDVSVKDIYSALYTGATLALVPRAYFSNPTQLMDYLAEVEATNLTWAVSALTFVSIMGGLDYLTPTTIRRVMFSGEVMPPKQLTVWQRHLPDARYVNLYGPTEITCNCTYFEVTRTYEPGEVIPMGKAFANERVFLLDENNLEVTKPDVVGEVCVAGTCLALGYLGDAERTAAVFCQNPLESRWPETIYRTGDLARFDERDDLVYVSRKDTQIKHLGQRIELTDIECHAQAIEGVEQACCLYDDVKKRIHLCYVGTPDRKVVKAELRESVPSYMVPNNTHQLDAFPLTKNGKIDRAALAILARIKR